MSRHPLADTCDEIIRGQVPNFLRPYLNPFVVQTCFCLGEYVRTTWPGAGAAGYQSFLANSFDEALAGAIKLARYSGHVEGRPPAGLVLDAEGRLGPFASVALEGGGTVEFVPGLTVVGGGDGELAAALRPGERFGFVVLVGAPGRDRDALRALVRAQTPLVIACVDRAGLAALRRDPAALAQEPTPDIVVFDESFVDRDVPFAAFTARRALYDHWNRRGRSTFHSTTFQPNAVSCLHFLRCLERADPEFHAAVAADLERIGRDPATCLSLLRALYSPFLARAIRALGFDALDVRAAGHYLSVGGRQVFDAVAGVACSVRGHNPPGYVAEVEGQPGGDEARRLLAARLEGLTGLGHLLPAVSGASAVENALRVGLAAQSPRRYVLALKGGFGGKTLLALAGTSQPSYKTNLSPLYEHVLYLDPFAPTAVRDLEQALERYPVGVVQLELVQAVGGVRPVPLAVVRYLEEQRRRRGYLLLVDEVQTGLYRTGPFTLSEKLGLTPDLLTLGKGTSDMMFPFALTLYSAEVQRRLEQARPDLPEAIRRRYDYDFGYRTALNVLQRCEEMDVPARVVEAGALFARLLGEGLASCRAVREVRGHGLLIGIELDTSRWTRRWLGGRVGWLTLLALLRHEPFPLFIGYCQYEPNVLKLTPPLTVTPEEVRRVCDAVAAVLRRPFYRLFPPALGALARLCARPRRRGEEVQA